MTSTKVTRACKMQKSGKGEGAVVKGCVEGLERGSVTHSTSERKRHDSSSSQTQCPAQYDWVLHPGLEPWACLLAATRTRHHRSCTCREWPPQTQQHRCPLAYRKVQSSSLVASPEPAPASLLPSRDRASEESSDLGLVMFNWNASSLPGGRPVAYRLVVEMHAA